MNSHNQIEYEMIRKEMTNLKDCITTYIGFVIGGSGVVFLTIATANKIMSKEDIVASYDTHALALFLFSLIINLVLAILFYKFNSHNRYAGYCKLLNQEEVFFQNNNNNKEESPYHIVAWESCMDALRDTDLENNFVKGLIEEIEIEPFDNETIRDCFLSLSGPTPSIDRDKEKGGYKVLIEALRGQIKTRSWQFPMFVTIIFLVLNLIFFVGGFYYLTTYFSTYPGNSFRTTFVFASSVMILCCNSLMWKGFLGKLHNLMIGSSTVESFCWKFLPIRHRYIKQKYPDCQYKLNILNMSRYMSEQGHR